MNLRGPYHWIISGAAELASVEQGSPYINELLCFLSLPGCWLALIVFCSEKYLYLITRRKSCKEDLHFCFSCTSIVSLGYHFIDVSDVSGLLIRAG